MNDPKIVVVKIGGKGAEDVSIVRKVAGLIRFLSQSGTKVVLVHGGGQALSSLAKRLHVKAEFIAGRRVTDDQLIDLAKMSFVGKVGTDLAAWLYAEGLRVVPLSGVSGGILKVTRRPPQPVGETLVDYGWVGDVTECDAGLVRLLLDSGYVPLVASLGVDHSGHVFNINADTVACSLGASLGAEELILLTEQKGLYRDLQDKNTLIPQITVEEIGLLIAEGVISGGMLPKLQALVQFLTEPCHFPQDDPRRTRYVRLIGWHDLPSFGFCALPSSGTIIYREHPGKS